MCHRNYNSRAQEREHGTPSEKIIWLKKKIKEGKKKIITTTNTNKYGVMTRQSASDDYVVVDTTKIYP